ncbi:uncharacterized protein BDW43DRAFT_92842 [Aspergillus alliaceus]|uniref:uncharacterized protein n=1 Tax=Petromyces alliaceus TaxID=209559 RepID=UPI0012A6A509|nr:uncharacterized protein BDW43DRAFT_92842 [Aspergillus alliaceus]KAB8233054.1 hypothetical protein BDW43DRAFT_92842 [Aspergillus alliaceus]
MFADQLLYPMGHSSQGDEWLDFDNFFEFPSGSVDSNPTSVNSISPKDLDLTYNDMDGSNWDSGLDMCTQIPFTDFVNHEPPFQEYFAGASGAEPVADPNDVLQLPPTSPNEVFVGGAFDGAWMPDAHDYDDQFFSTIRHMVESKAAVDPRCSSKKEKRREAAIALHLQRLGDAPLPEIDMSPESNTSFPSPPWSVSRDATCVSPATTSLSEPTSKSPTPPSGDTTPGGMELVLDLNMNTPANLPRKQKPRSRAQKENYIKVRKHGACEKHRKQHKRCNCLDINGSRLDVHKSALATTAVLDSTRQTSVPLQGPLHTRPRHVSLPKQAQVGVLPPNVQPPKSVIRTVKDDDVRCLPQDNRRSIASPLDGHHGRYSPGSLPKPMETANAGQLRPQVPHSSSPTTPWRGLVQTPSVPGRLKSPSHRSLVTTTSLPSVMERGIYPGSAVSYVSSGLPQAVSWCFSQVTKESRESLVRTQSRVEMGTLPPQSVPTNLSSSVGTRQVRVAHTSSNVTSQASVGGDSIIHSKFATTAIFRTGLAAASFWQNMRSVISCAKALFGKFAVFASKQHWFARKGMGLI